MLRPHDGRVHDLILIFSVRCFQHDQIMELDVGQRTKKCVAMTRESDGAHTFRNGTFGKVPDCVAQCFLIHALRDDR